MDLRPHQVAMLDEARAHMDCSVDGCTHKAACRGLCRKHWETAPRKLAKAYKGAPCSVAGCARGARSSGMCGAHYMRHKRYGDASYVTGREEWLARCRAAAPKLGKAKSETYKKLHSRHEHRVVAERMLGRALKHGEIVHHKDGNKHNNDPANLEVMTQAEHARLHMLERYGHE